MAKKRKPRSKSLVKAAKRRAREDQEAYSGREHGPIISEASSCSAPQQMHVNGQQQHAARGQRPGSGRGAETMFERYYSEQGIVQPAEWDSFIAALRRPLPITIRMNSMHHLAGEVSACLEAAHDLLYPSERSKLGMPTSPFGEPLPAPRVLTWCKGWQFPCDKNTAKFGASPYMRGLQKWLAANSSMGLLTRQEVVSMIPAALLRVMPSHKCLDLCASPGSKTTQLLEGLYSHAPSGRDGNSGSDEAGEKEEAVTSRWEAASGVVVANDFSPSRAYLLVRRCAALGLATSRLMIVAHNAQRFPNTLPPMVSEWSSSGSARRLSMRQVGGDTGGGSAAAAASRYPEGQYDRVLCDVPCSGDGTLRKNPESWSTWGPDYGSSLHTLQLRIAQRGAALLKVGGLMAYSTCSFNPVEDEAVVAELLRRCRGALELVNTGTMLPTLRRRPGLSTWKVMDDDGNHYPTFESSQAASVPEARRRMYVPSMWPPPPQSQQGEGKYGHGQPQQLRLSRCLRLLPHLQDTGGFFVALFRKVAPLPGPEPKHVAQPAELKQPLILSPAGLSQDSGARLISNNPRLRQPPSVGIPLQDQTASSPLLSAPQGHSAQQAHVPLPADQLASLEALFGLRGKRWKAVARHLRCRAGGGHHRAVYYVSDTLLDEYLEAPGAGRLKQVLVGCKLFQWESMRGNHTMRITPEGVELILPMATKRVVTVSKEDMAALLHNVNKPLRAAMTSRPLEQAIAQLDPGPCIWHVLDASLGLDIAVPGEVSRPWAQQQQHPMMFSSTSSTGRASSDQHKSSSCTPIAAAAARYPFVRGREHAPKATAQVLLRKLSAS